MSAKLAAALADLITRIDQGEEYPDAEFRVSQKFGVRASELRNAYDESCK